MRKFLLSASIACMPTICVAQANWAGPAGGGMMAVQEASVITPGHGALALVFDNYDRDPLGIDVFDVRIDWRIGAYRNLEFFGRYHISRAVSVPGVSPIPPPPLDIITTSPMHGPYRSTYWPMPYLTHHTGVISEMVPGEYTLGAKYHVRNQRTWSPAVALSGYVNIPGDMSRTNLQKGSSSGSIDVGTQSAATWNIGVWNISTNLGFQHNSDTSSDDRIITLDGRAADIQDVILHRPDFLTTSIGARRKLFSHLSAITELYHWQPIGSATPGATDVLTGLELCTHHIAFTAGVRQHLSAPRNDIQLPTGPLTGALDLSALSDTAQREYLKFIGITPDVHRTGANLVVVNPPQEMAPPRGAHYIPRSYPTHTTGNTGLVVSLSLYF